MGGRYAWAAPGAVGAGPPGAEAAEGAGAEAAVVGGAEYGRAVAGGAGGCTPAAGCPYGAVAGTPGTCAGGCCPPGAGAVRLCDGTGWNTGPDWNDSLTTLPPGQERGRTTGRPY